MLPIDKLPSAPYPISLVTFGVLKTGAPFTQQGDTPIFKSFKSLLGLSLLAFFGVWMGCSSDSSPVSPSNKAVTDDDGSGTQVSTFTVYPDSTEVVFNDVQLHHAVRRKVKPDAPIVATITRADMLRLTALDASNKGITDLTGLEHATNLDTLTLGGNDIEDLNPLRNLTSLEYLHLRKNSITNLQPLAALTNLQYLRLQGNKITDVTPLAGLTNLKTLIISQNTITNLQPLATLTNLQYLNLNYNQTLTDVSPLESLTNLETLWLAHTQVADVSPLTCLTNLETLWLPADNDILTAQSLNIYIPFLQATGVTVRRDAET